MSYVIYLLYICFFFLMIRRPPRSTRTDTLFPYTTLSRTGFGQPALLADAIVDVPSDNLRHAFDEARRPGDRSRRLFGSAGTLVLLADDDHSDRGLLCASREECACEGIAYARKGG